MGRYYLCELSAAQRELGQAPERSLAQQYLRVAAAMGDAEAQVALGGVLEQAEADLMLEMASNRGSVAGKAALERLMREKNATEGGVFTTPRLFEPVWEPETSCGGNNQVTYATAAVQGCRGAMEGVCLSHKLCVDLGEQQSFFGVFDGHGGAAVAWYCANHLCDAVRGTQEFSAGEYERALSRGFLAMDDAITELDRKMGTMKVAEDEEFLTPDHCGTTACCLLLVDGVVHMANAGDSRCVLCRSGEAVQLSEEHKPHVSGEAERIIAAGCEILSNYIEGRMDISRTIGDMSLKSKEGLERDRQPVIATPQVLSLRLSGDDEFAVLCSDGVTDCLTNWEIVSIARPVVRQAPGDPEALRRGCIAVLDRCKQKWTLEQGRVGTDNMSVAIVSFAPHSPSRT
eukprot:m51a1_g12823 hypothetical protein (401) ;mRNA; r:1637-3112